MYQGLIRTKMIVSGSLVELFYFPEALFIDPSASRDRALKRARTSLKRVISANAGQWVNPATGERFMPLFLTLTFADNVQDITYANKLFNRFIKRVNYSLFGSRKAVLKYSVVMEFQKRGAIHYHAILYNVPYIIGLKSKLDDLWSHGFIFINSVKNVKSVGAYVVKYMSKDFQDDRLQGKKAYFSSRGLIKPSKYYDRQAEDLALELPLPFQEAEFEGVRYSKYFIGDYPLSVSYPQPVDKYVLNQGVLY